MLSFSYTAMYKLPDAYKRCCVHLNWSPKMESAQHVFAFSSPSGGLYTLRDALNLNYYPVDKVLQEI